jgi:WD40 repeat protein
MTLEEALIVLEEVLQPVRLNDTQDLVFRQAWSGKTYAEIAEEWNFATEHIRAVGAQLWRMLTKALGERVTRQNFKAVLTSWARKIGSQLTRANPNNHQDWGEAVDVSTFFGRTDELSVLEQWVVHDRCRLVALLGMGGIGKTSLSVKLADQIKGHFDWLIWRSLRNAPHLKELLTDLLHFLANGDDVPLATEVDEQLSQLMHYLRDRRCLIILDNAETLLYGADSAFPGSYYAGVYREGYADYGDLFRLIGEVAHESCLLLTSREEPREVDLQKGEHTPVRTLRLQGLTSHEGQEIFKIRGTFSASKAQWHDLVQHYAGNPLALKIVSSVIKDLFNGAVSQFLDLQQQGVLIFDDIRDLLHRQFERLSGDELEVMYWLAINREPIFLEDLRRDILPPLLKRRLPEVLKSLGRRLVIEHTPRGFTQQPVVMEYLTERFVEQVCLEICTEEINLLMSHAFVKVQSKSYLMDSQVRIILQAIADRLCDLLRTPKNVELQLRRILTKLQAEYADVEGYAAGNLLNLLNHLGVDLTGYDFSNLVVWQGNLQGVNLHRVNFAHSDLSRCLFTETLGNIWALAFSPNGQLLAVSDMNNIHLWRVADGTKLLTFGQPCRCNYIVFSPTDGVLASSSDDGIVRLWDGETGQCLHALKGHQDWILAVAYSADGRWLASSSADGTVKLWDTTTGECRQTLRGHTNWIRGIAFAPSVATETGDNQIILISGSADDTLRFWDGETGTCLATVEAGCQGVWAIAFSPDGQSFATGGTDGTVKLWNFANRECTHTLRGHTSTVRSLAYAVEGYSLASGSEDNTVRLWDSHAGECYKVLHGHMNNVWSVATTHNHLLASGSLDQQVKLWDIRTGQCLSTLRGYSDALLTVALTSPSREPETGQTFSEWNTSDDVSTWLDYPPLLATGSANHSIRLWDLDSGECLKTLHGHTNWVLSVAFSPLKQAPPERARLLLASCGFDRTVRLWDVASGKCVHILKGHTNWVRSVQFSPDGYTLASCSFDRTIRLWDIATGECQQILEGHTERLFTAVFSPTGHTLASAGDDLVIRLWDVRTGINTQTFEAHSERIWSIAFSPDGKLLASGSGDRTVQLWDVTTGERIQTLRGHSSKVLAVAFSPDGRLVASGGEDRTVKLWDTATGEYLTTLQGHSNRVWSLMFGQLQEPEARSILASSSDDETVRLWDTTTGECIKTLHSLKPYQSMDITEVKGLTDAQKNTLKVLGAIEVV